ncbi:MAG: hypothetical protein QXG86_00050 [Candidatus Woesearchaeota archaeon]
MVELKFNVEKQNIQVFEDVYSKIECEGIAIGKKEKGFGIISKFKKLVSSKDNIKLSNFEKRYEPFWHLLGESNLEYKRKTEYGFDVRPEVKSVKIEGKVYEIREGTNYCSFIAEDHCFEHFKKEIFVDANTGANVDYKRYLDFKTYKIEQTEELMKEKTVVVPAKVKASFLVRQLIKDLIKPFEADKVIKEEVVITKLALYFRPIYSFEFIDSKSGKRYILDVDALTGEVKKGSMVGKALAEIFHEGDLFEIGTEFITDFIPGTKAGVMIAQKIKAARKRKKEEKERNRLSLKGK